MDVLTLNLFVTPGGAATLIIHACGHLTLGTKTEFGPGNGY